MEIKICGLRREEDIKMVNKYNIDYAGFIFAESKRKVLPELAKLLISKLRKDICKVGIFVNTPIDEVNAIAEFCGLDVVQLHGSETPEDCKKVKKRVWKALSVVDDSIELELLKYKEVVECFVLDQGKGGTGKSFDWGLIVGLTEKYNIILAGGLNRSNVLEAIERVNPKGIDMSSGVESDGFKDENKIKEIVELVRG